MGVQMESVQFVLPSCWVFFSLSHSSRVTLISMTESPPMGAYMDRRCVTYWSVPATPSLASENSTFATMAAIWTAWKVLHLYSPAMKV